MFTLRNSLVKVKMGRLHRVLGKQKDRKRYDRPAVASGRPRL